MKYLKTFENFEIGDNTNIGVIQDKTDTQYQINNNWYHHTIVKPSDKKQNEPLHNRGRINPNLVIPAFSNHIYPEKLEKYIDVFKSELLENDFPPIKGYPIILTTHDIERFETFLNGDDISTSDIGKYAWIVTDGYHRTLAAIEADMPYILTEVDYSYVDESDYVNESKSEIKYKKDISDEDNIE